jgi:hypothetical protein
MLFFPGQGKLNHRSGRFGKGGIDRFYLCSPSAPLSWMDVVFFLADALFVLPFFYGFDLM